MKAALVIGLLIMVPIAAADPYALTNGVIIAHAPPDLAYSSDLDVCSSYAPLETCEQQVNRIDSTDEAAVWYVILAWDEPKIWYGVEFGLGDYVAGTNGYMIVDHGTCAPPGGAFYISSHQWPGPGEGTRIISISDDALVWSGNFVPIYWFAGYAYSAQRIPLGPHPATGRIALLPVRGHGQPPSFDLPLDTPGIIGAMGMSLEGTAACPRMIGVCCLTYSDCVLTTYVDCAARGGVFEGPDMACDACSHSGACCVGTDCYLLTEVDCISTGGIWHEGEQCDEEACPDCFACPPQPVSPIDWGAVKAAYR